MKTRERKHTREVGLSAHSGEQNEWERDKWKQQKEGGNRDVHKEIKNTVFHESFHVLVRLPLLCRFVHVN